MTVQKRRRSGTGFSGATTPPPRRPRPSSSAAEGPNPEQQALTLIQQGRAQDAEVIYRRLIQEGRASAQTFCNLAVVCGLDERWDEVVLLCRQALQRHPGSAEVHNNLGAALIKTGHPDDAIVTLQQAIALDPTNFNACLNLGGLLEGKGQCADAHNYLVQALSIRPGDPQTIGTLGRCLRRQGQIHEAIRLLRDALADTPEHPNLTGELAISHYEAGDLELAIEAYRLTLKHWPEDAGFHRNLAIALVEAGAVHEALIHFEKALQLDPGNVDLEFNSSMAHLYLPEGYATGWKRYECRARRTRDPILPDATPGCPEWDGHPLKEGDHLLVVSEQGYGDTLQFMRYVSYLRESWGVVASLCVPEKLHGLIRASGIDALPIAPAAAPAVKRGHWIAMMSLPGRLGVSPATPLWQKPYLRASEALQKRWRERLAVETGPIVAINWQGNPDHEQTAARGRSLPLEAFAPIATHTHATLLSLQKGVGSEQLASCSFRDRFVRCQDQVDQTWDFLETAAIIANCDLVITSDTAVAHLAGGMGKSTWLLLKKVPEWRWGLEGDSTFWYPSMRLFRQQEAGQWPPLLERVALELRSHLQTIAPADPDASLSRTALDNCGPLTPRPLVEAPIPLADLIDRVAALQVEAQRVTDPDRAALDGEREVLEAILGGLGLAVAPELIAQLRQIHHELARIQAALRMHDDRAAPGEASLPLLQALWQHQERRSALLAEINTSHGPPLSQKARRQKD